MKELILASIFFTILILASLALASVSENRFLQKLFEDPVAFFTMILCGFTMFLGVATIMLWAETRKGIREQGRIAFDQQELTSKSFELSKSAVQISAETLKLSGENMQRELRAYLSLTGQSLDISRSIDGKDIVSFSLTASNFGKTPAYRIFTVVKVAILTWPFPHGSEIPWPTISEKERNETVGMIAGGQNIVLQSNQILNINDTSANTRICILIILTYTDSFQHTRESRMFGSVIESSEYIDAYNASCRGQPTNLPKVRFESAYRGNTST